MVLGVLRCPRGVVGRQLRCAAGRSIDRWLRSLGRARAVWHAAPPLFCFQFSLIRVQLPRSGEALGRAYKLHG